MDFSGQIFFDFETFDVWRLYSTLLAASRDGSVRVDVTWEEFLAEEVDPGEAIRPTTRLLGACAGVRDAHPKQHQRFVQALLTLIYQEKDDPKKDTTLVVAAKVAGLDGEEVIARAIDPGLLKLREGSSVARERGVVHVPTVVSNGPPLYLKMTGAAASGSAVMRLDLINRMLHDDGIWAMSKPSTGS